MSAVQTNSNTIKVEQICMTTGVESAIQTDSNVMEIGYSSPISRASVAVQTDVSELEMNPPSSCESECSRPD